MRQGFFKIYIQWCPPAGARSSRPSHIRARLRGARRRLVIEGQGRTRGLSTTTQRRGLHHRSIIERRLTSAASFSWPAAGKGLPRAVLLVVGHQQDRLPLCSLLWKEGARHGSVER